MDATLGLIAEYATISNDGKLSVLGIFDQMSSATFPTGVPIFYVVVSLAAGPAEFGSQRQIGIALHSQDGKELFKSESTETVPKAPLPGIKSAMNRIWAFPGVGFVNPGTYEFSILVDGRTERTIPLYILQLKGEQP